VVLTKVRVDPIPGHGLPSLGFTITNNDVPQSVVLLWTSDQPQAETSTRQPIHSQQTSMSLAEFEPANPATERLQTHALVSAAAAIGRS